MIEEYIPAEENDETGQKSLLFPLSARSESQLKEMATRLKACLESSFAGSEPLRLRDIAHTLQFGRKSFDHRLVIIASSREQLLELLATYADGGKNQNILTGNTKNGSDIHKLLSKKEREEFAGLLSQSRDNKKLAQLWNSGVIADWQGFKAGSQGYRVSLPTYPFADKRHWLAASAQIQQAGASGKAIAHPLLDSNESTFERQLFKKTFTEKEFFIYDHLVSDIPTLPGVALSGSCP